MNNTKKDINIHTTKDKILNDLNKILNAISSCNVEMKHDISLSELLQLKKALHSVNNYITYVLTTKFIDLLEDWCFLDKNQSENIIAELNRTSSNTNGFDVLSDGKIKIVAEVKGLVPVKGNEFGAAQKSSLKKDILGLLQGKNKVKNIDINSFYRFMVILSVNNYGIAALNNFLESKSNEEIRDKIAVVKNKQDIDFEKVNVILIELNQVKNA